MRRSFAWPTTCSCAIRSLRPHSSFFATRCQTKTMCPASQEHCHLSAGNATEVQSASGSLIDTSCVSILSAEARPFPERTGARHGYERVTESWRLRREEREGYERCRARSATDRQAPLGTYRCQARVRKSHRIVATQARSERERFTKTLSSAERNPTASAPVSTAASPRLEISTRGGYGPRRPATVERVRGAGHHSCPAPRRGR